MIDININEASKHNIKFNRYELEEIQKRQKQLQPFAAFGEVAVMTYSRDNGNILYFYSAIYYKGHGLEIYCAKEKEGFSFSLLEKHLNKHTQYINKQPKPSKIKKPTAKKLDEWLEYLLNERQAKKDYSDKHEKQQTEFIKRLEKLGDIVNWVKDRKSGTILKGGLEYIFYLQDSNIYEKIEIHYRTSENLENFLLMSNNQKK